MKKLLITREAITEETFTFHIPDEAAADIEYKLGLNTQEVCFGLINNSTYKRKRVVSEFSPHPPNVTSVEWE